jgi:hypothetical protein
MSTKRVQIAIALCLLLAPVTAGSVKAQESEPGPCYFFPFGSETITFNESECTTIVLGTIEWAALSRGLVNEFLRATSLSFSAQGPGLDLAMDEEETAMLWSPISEVPSVEYGITCPHRADIQDTVWMKDLGDLEPGVYHIHAVLTLRHPIHDGLQQCSYLDGTPVGHDKYGPWYWVNDITMTILDQ